MKSKVCSTPNEAILLIARPIWRGTLIWSPGVLSRILSIRTLEGTPQVGPRIHGSPPYELRSILLVSPRIWIVHEDPTRALIVVPTWNPKSILDMLLLSTILTAAPLSCSQNIGIVDNNWIVGGWTRDCFCDYTTCPVWLTRNILSGATPAIHPPPKKKAQNEVRMGDWALRGLLFQNSPSQYHSCFYTMKQ